MVPLVEYAETNLRRFAQQPITRLEPARADSSETASECLVDDHETERTRTHGAPFEAELVGRLAAGTVYASFSFWPPDLPPASL